jgi:radical SAM family RiPP maturation amino acid epimerase
METLAINKDETIDSQYTFKEIFESYSEEERFTLAHIKRFLECLTGDEVFRERLIENRDNPTKIAEEYGICVDAELMRPLYDSEFSHQRFENSSDQFPLAKLWDKHFEKMVRSIPGIVNAGSTRGFHDKFDKWRCRQINRCHLELGPLAKSIAHPIAAFELSKGCTVGCWFCGISADKFEGHFEYNDVNVAYWREMLKVFSDKFGKQAAGQSFCYWATDPSDNPDFDKFLKIFHEELNWLPQTTTAAPLKNIELTRRLLEQADFHSCVPTRFSVLSQSMLRKIHKEFTPLELFQTELILQYKQSLTSLTSAGKAWKNDKLARNNGKDSVEESDDGTIACVTGFLVKPLENRIQLVSPTRTSTEWKDGYVIFGERTFRNAEELSFAIDSLIESHIDNQLRGTDVLQLGANLRPRVVSQNIMLTNKHTVLNFKNKSWCSTLLNKMHEGSVSKEDILKEGVEMGVSPLNVLSFMDHLHLSGALTKY